MAPKRHDQEGFFHGNEIYDMFGAISGIFEKSGGFHGFIDDTIANYGISRGLFLLAIFCGLWAALWEMIPNLPLLAAGWLIGTMPIWIFPMSVGLGWSWWMWYTQSWQVAKQKRILLEVRMPHTIVKSPRAMEAVFAHFRQFGGATNTFINKYWNGGVPPTFSFEIVSLGGTVHFYVNIWEAYRRTVEEALYSQYPEVEIVEVEDYATLFKYDPELHQPHCFDWRLEPNNDAYPIKTYVDWEIEEEGEEEYKIDPFAQVMETLSSMRPNEQAWIQIIIIKNGDTAPGDRWFKGTDRYQKQVHEAVDKIRKEVIEGPHPDPNKPEQWRNTAARIEQFHVGETLRAIERNAGKINYAVGMRGVYIASPPDSFSGTAKDNFRLVWRSMGDETFRNHLRHRRWHPPLDFAWQDFRDTRFNLICRRYFDCYRRRSHFYAPWIFPHNVMSVEVLATLWHPPSHGIHAHGLEHIESKKRDAPHNLPV